MWTKSRPIIVEPVGIIYVHTYIQPPGAAHRSTTVCELLRKLYLRFNWNNLKAALDLYP